MLAPTSLKQEMMLNHDAQILVLGGAAGGTKVQPYSSDIYTPWGIKKMGDLKVGDIISSVTGSPQKVLQIFEKGIIDVYECEFDDGSKCEVGEDHLWLVRKTRSHKTKKDTFYSGYFSDGFITDTKFIISFLDKKRKSGGDKFISSQNLIIPICDPIKFNLNKIKVPLHPYLLGILIGDGCLKTKTPSLTCFDQEIIEKINNIGYEVTERKEDGQYSFLKETGVQYAIEELGLYKKGSIDKFIPESYKWLTVDQRLELAQGLMDSDGTVDIRGHLKFTSISKRLAKDFQWLLRSIGCSVTMTESVPICTNSSIGRKECDTAYTLYIKPKNNYDRFFSLNRKKDRCRDIEFNGGISDVGRRFKSIKLVRKEIGRCIAVSDPSRLYITNDFIVTHNTYTLNMIPVMRYTDCPDFNGIMFRRTTVQLKGQGGMWATANDIFSKLGDNKPKVRDYDLTATWYNGPEDENGKPTAGAKMKYSHMEHVKNRLDHQGLQYTFVGFDEGTHFEWEQVEYLMSRLRSKSKYPSRMVISCNPDPDSWLYEMIEWYLDEEGYPDKDKDGFTRYFIRRDGKFIWSNSKEELVKKYSTKYKKAKPISFSFISSTIYDNPICMRDNPEYVDFLEGLNKIEKARLLYGNWKVRPEGSNYFQREDLNKAFGIPQNAICVRAWDKAGTEPSDINKYPDFTACIKMYKTCDNEFYISGEFHNKNHDNDLKDIYGKFRHKPGRRDNIILSQARYDGEDCKIILPVDPGAHGNTEYIESAKKLAIHNFIVKKDPVASTKSKLQKFAPFSASAENGLIYILEDTFPNKATLEAFYKELEGFDGERSGKLRKDDWPDAVATAYNYLVKEVVIPDFSLPKCGVNNNILKMKKAVA